MIHTRIPLVLASSLALSAAAPAQIAEPRRVDPAPVLNFPTEVTHGDIDGDGLPDVVVFSEDDQRPLWYRNLGNAGMSGAREFLPGLTGGEDMQLADLDGNGTLDFVSWGLDGLTGVMTWASNQRGDPFVLQSSVLTPAVSGRVIAKDWSGDGIVDLLVYGSGLVHTYVGSGTTATYSGQVLANHPGPGIGSFVFGDVNGDGMEDLVFQKRRDPHTMAPATIEVHVQNASAGFDPGVGIDFPLSGSNLNVEHPLGLVDVDSDGDLDIVQVGRNLVILINDAGFTTAPTSIVSLPSPITDAQFADLDGDLDLDLAIAGSISGIEIYEYINGGLGNLLPGQIHAVVDRPRHLDTVDLNSDGLLDYVISSGDRDTLSSCERTSSSTFSSPELIAKRAHGAFKVVDLNQDGLVDVIDLSNALNFYEQRALGGFKPPMGTRFAAGESLFPSLHVADVDGDGFPDAVVRSVPNDVDISLYLGGPSGFGAGVNVITFPTNDSYLDPLTIDINSDGRLDLLFTGYYQGKLTGLLNHGANGWSGLMDLGDIIAPGETMITDIDGDGLEDVLVISGVFDQGARLYALRNLGGAGGLGAPMTIGPFQRYMRQIRTMDVDDDGDLDIIYIHEDVQQRAHLAWQEHLSGFVYAAPQVLATLGFSTPNFDSIEVTDWNQDGLDDVLLYHTGGRLKHFRNLGGGQFAPFATLGTEVNARRLCAVDIEGDLDADLLYFDNRLDTMLYRENLSSTGSTYCVGELNSTGSRATLTASGSSIASVNRLALSASGLPQGSFGHFLLADLRDLVVNAGGSQGNLCLGGEVGRYNRGAEVLFSGREGQFRLVPDLGDTPRPTGSVAILAGQTWCFQAWYRDANPTLTSNFTDAVEIAFD